MDVETQNEIKGKWKRREITEHFVNGIGLPFFTFLHSVKNNLMTLYVFLVTVTMKPKPSVNLQKVLVSKQKVIILSLII